MSRTRRAIHGTLTSFLQYGLQIILQIALVPVILRFAGKPTLGAYAVIVQAMGYLSLFDLGFSIALGRYLSQAMGLDDSFKRFTEVLTSARAFFFIASTFYCIAAIILAFCIQPLVHLDTSLGQQAKIGILLLAGWSLLRAPISIYSAALVATQNLATRNIISIVSNVIRLVGSIYLVWINWGLLGLILANLVAEVVDLATSWFVFRTRYPEVRLRVLLPKFSLFFEMLKFSGQAMLINIGVRLVFFTDNIVVGGIFGAVAAGIYFSTQTPAALGWNIIMRLADNASPGINELHTRGGAGRIKSIFFALHRYTLIFSVPLAIGIALLNGAAISLWVGPDQYGGNLISWALAGFTCLVCAGHVNMAFIVAIGNIQIVSILALIEGFVNLGLSIWLGHKIGLGGVMLATVLANIPTTLYSQFRAHRDLNVGLVEFFQRSIFPTLLPALLSLIVLLLLRRLFPPLTWLRFGIVGSTFLAVHAFASFLFALTPEERGLVQRTTIQMLKRVAIHDVSDIPD